MSGKLQTVSKNGIRACCRFNLNFNFLYVHQGSKYSSSHTLHFSGFCVTLQTGIGENDRIMQSYYGNTEHVAGRIQIHFLIWATRLSMNPTKYMSLTLNLHLENLWLTILDIVFYRIYDGSKSNNSVYSYVCPIPRMSLQSHKPADRKKRR